MFVRHASPAEQEPAVDGEDACEYAHGDVGGGEQGVARFQHGERLAGKGAERGEAAAEACHQEQPQFDGQRVLADKSGKQADGQRTNEVDRERGPRKGAREHARYKIAGHGAQRTAKGHE